jgi:excisionase family DNA binding protein
MHPRTKPPISNHDPLVVTPRVACRLLSLGNTRLYELIRQRELDSYVDGRRGRRITLAPIRAYIACRLPNNAERSQEQPPRPGPPRKSSSIKVERTCSQ